jgi:hypothetical protein
MKKINSMALTIFALLFISACGDNQKKEPGEKIKLQLNYPAGFEQVIVFDMSNTGSPILNMQNITEVKFRLDSVIDNKTYSFDVNVLRISSMVKSDGKTENYDSGKGDKDPSFDPYLENPLTIQIGRNGKVVQPFQFAGSQRKAEDILDMTKVQIPFPEKEIAVGDTWQSESANDLTSTTMQTTYELKEVTADEIKIEMTAALKDPPSYIGIGKLNGEYILDRKTNKLKQGKFESTLKTGGQMMVRIYEK